MRKKLNEQLKMSFATKNVCDASNKKSKSKAYNDFDQKSSFINNFRENPGKRVSDDSFQVILHDGVNLCYTVYRLYIFLFIYLVQVLRSSHQDAGVPRLQVI